MITVLFGGSRPEGNTARLTKMAIAGYDYEWIDLTQYQLNPVRDYRHEDKSIDSYADDYKTLIDKVLASDTVIIASPVYWYSLSASMKAFLIIGLKLYWIQIIKTLKIRCLRKILDLLSLVVIVLKSKPNHASHKLNIV